MSHDQVTVSQTVIALKIEVKLQPEKLAYWSEAVMYTILPITQKPSVKDNMFLPGLWRI